MGEKPKVVIYGTNHQAQQLKVLIELEEAAKVCAFMVDTDFKKGNTLLGLDVYEFENLDKHFSPEAYQIVLSFGYKNMVKNRELKFYRCVDKGYRLFTYISKNADVYSEDIGEGSLIYPGCFVAPFVHLGKGCFLENGVTIAHHTAVSDFVFCAPRVNICGDTMIGNNCFLGANCTIGNAIHLGERTLVGAGAVLLRDTVDGSIIFPARSTVVDNRCPESLI